MYFQNVLFICRLNPITQAKDLENILFKESDLTYNKIKKKLYTLYKFPNKSKISDIIDKFSILFYIYIFKYILIASTYIEK